MDRAKENSSEGSEDLGGRGLFTDDRLVCKDVNPNPDNVNPKTLVNSSSGKTVNPPEQLKSILTEKEIRATKDIQGKAETRERARQECSIFDVENFLKTITHGKEVNRPLLEVTVMLDVIRKLTKETLTYLARYSLKIFPDDEMVLEQVTILQARAKVAKARATTEVSQTVESLPMDKIVKHLSRVIASHKVLIDQLGVVEHEGQLIVPRLQIDKNLRINIDQIIHKYGFFVKRVEGVFSKSFFKLDFDDVRGSMAQLVGSRIDEYCRKWTWCNKNVPIDVLILGGGLEFGFESRDLLHNEKIKCVDWILDNDNFLSMVQSRNDPRVRWPLR